MDPRATLPERRRARIEAGALALLAALPLLPYFLYLAKVGIPRFAFTELATRLVATGKTLLGPYSRFGFSHPGPLYFYVMAPIYALLGGTSGGLFAAACSVNVASAMTTVATVRLATTRAHGIAVTRAIATWLAAYGTACVLPWNPLVVVLPLIALLVLCALVARGSRRLAPLAVLVGAVVAETHLSTVPTVVGVALAAVAVVVVQARRGQRVQARERQYLLLAAGVLFLAVFAAARRAAHRARGQPHEAHALLPEPEGAAAAVRRRVARLVLREVVAARSTARAVAARRATALGHGQRGRDPRTSRRPPFAPPWRCSSRACSRAPCLHSFAKSGDVELLISDGDVTECPAR